jgi:hypothetical protein
MRFRSRTGINVVRCERGKGLGGAFTQIVAKPFKPEFPVAVSVDLHDHERDDDAFGPLFSPQLLLLL